MKFSLVFLLCSYVAGECMPPHIHSTQFDDEYDCLTVGYSESLIKIEEIGREEINLYSMYIKFGCYPTEQTEQTEEKQET